MFISKLLILVLLFTFITAETSWQHRPCADLQMGQFKCTQPVIDDLKQNEINCTADNLVKVSCYPAENVTCNRKRFDGKTIGFYKSVKCRYVTNYYYQTAVLLSIFFGIFGIDRFYLGYIAIGLLKFCTFGFMLIGYLFDMILIITQTLKPSDGSNYIVDYYGQILIPSNLYNNHTFNLTFD
jgi:TM2 domain-containing membrane protein YozV